MFEKLKLSDTTVASIEWDMTPDLAFCTFSAKGLRDELTNTNERICYFFIDNYGEEPKLYLMERGIRHVNILAEIKAPLAMLSDCIINQGGTLSSKDNFPVDPGLKQWLLTEVVRSKESPFLIPAIEKQQEKEDFGAALPPVGKTGLKGEKIILPGEHSTFQEEEIGTLIKKWDFFDSVLNPQGFFDNALASNGDGLTVVEEQTGIMWQQGGLDLCSIRSMMNKIEQINKEGFAGYHDWRIPTVEEAMSLMEAAPNEKGMHLPPCFSKEQPFIFVAARRTPTGYWFVDYAQGKIYWSSGTVPGGFSRLCRRFD